MEAAGIGVHGSVVGDELFLDEGLLKDRVTRVGEVQAAVGGEMGAGVLMELCSLGKREMDIDCGKGVGSFLQGSEVFADLLAKVNKEVVFERFGPLVGAENLLLHLFESGGDVALGIGHRLLADIIVGHFVQLGAGDFEEVTEDVVELNLESFDASAFAFGFL